MGGGKLIRCWGFCGWMLLVGISPGIEAQTPSSTAAPQLQWEKRLAGRVRNFEFSSDGRYLAALTDKGIALLETSGRLLWELPYSSISPWIRETDIFSTTTVAVAPKGQWVAVGGTINYRYVWVLDKRGRKQWYVKTTGTPQALAITRQGDLLAIGTAGGHVYLVSLHGKVLTDVKLAKLGEIVIISALSFSADDAVLRTTRGVGIVALLNRHGKVVWKRDGAWLTVTASRGRHWFIVTDNWRGVPLYDEPVDTVTLFSEDGKEVWRKSLHFVEALIAPDGSYVVVAGALQSPAEPSPPIEERVVLVLDWQGHVLAEWQDEDVGSLLFISQDGRHIVTGQVSHWVCRDREGRIIQHLEREWSTQPKTPASDLSFLVIAREDTLRAYRVAEDWPCGRETTTVPQWR